MKLKFAVGGLLALVVFSLSAWAVEDGSAGNPYLIGSEADLAKITQYGMGEAGKGKCFELTADFALTAPWAGIGTYAKTDPTDYFSGIFDGKGHKISNVVMSNAGTADGANNYRGFFNQIDGGTVKNLTVATTGFGATPPSGEYGCAAIAGAAYDATLQSCAAEGTVSGTHNVGGVVVRIRDASLVACTNKATVTGSYTKVAGICVLNESSTTGCLIEGCVNEGTVTAANGTTAGRDGIAGIIAYVGDETLTIADCANKGTVAKGADASSSAKVGQIVGYNYKGVKALEGTIKGTTGVRMVGDVNGKAIDRHLATVSGSVATLVADSAVADGGSYKVMATGGTVTLARIGDGLTIDDSLASITVQTSAADGKLVKDGNRYTSVSDGEIDISKAVRDAGKGTTKLESGSNYSGYKIDNAFGNGEGMWDRVLLNAAYNVIGWTISDDFAKGQPLVVTKFTIKRTSPASSTTDPFGQNRAPTEFYFQGSNDGTSWITLYEVSVTGEQKANYWGDNELEKTFEIDPSCYGDYRKYRFVAGASNATAAPKCSFQYIKVLGTVGDYGTLASAVRPLDHFVMTADTGAFINDYKPTLDSKIEVDVALSDVSKTSAVVIGGATGGQNQMRLFYMQDSGWTYFYGSTQYKSNVKASAGARYRITIDGPKVSVNGREVVDAGTKLTVSAGSALRVFGSPATDADTLLYNNASGRFWGLKAWKADGTQALDLRPVLAVDGGAQLQDVLSKKLYRSYLRTDKGSLPIDFKVHKWLNDFTANVRGKAMEPTVTLVEGTLADAANYPVEKVISTGMTKADRALFSTMRNVIQYDIPADYNPGYPMVLARFSITPLVYDSTEYSYTINRAPHHFELQASKDGENNWVTLCKVEGSGSGPGAYARNGYRKVTVDSKTYYSYYGCHFDIPEEKRDDYRHYRLVTTKSSAGENDGTKIGFQELKFFGYDGGFEMAYEPVAYVQNAVDKQKGDNTYFKTGVTPQACDLTIEMKGSFTRIDQTHCLFCARDKDGNKTWTLFLLNGALRLDCKSSGSASSFKPKADTLYTIKVQGNKLYVDDNLIYTSGATDFVPGSEIALLSSHKALASDSWDNQARFRLQSCKITDSCGGVIRDYIAVKRADGKAGLFDRANDVPNTRFCASDGTNPIVGASLDDDFWQRDRGVTLTTELDERGKLPEGPLTFAFAGNQRLGAELYAAFDNAYRGNATNEWAEVVKLGDVKTGEDTLEVTLPETDWRRVKFFVCDKMARNVSYTQAYKNRHFGTVILIR